MRGILLTLLPSLAAIFAGDRGGNCFAVVADKQPQQQHDDAAECEGWAAVGECNLNPKYMWQHCSASCGEMADADRAMAEEIGEGMLYIFFRSHLCSCARGARVSSVTFRL